MSFRPHRSTWEKAVQVSATAPREGMRWIQTAVGRNPQPHIHYIVPEANWATDWVGHYITRSIRQQFDWPTSMTSLPHLLNGHILHYGELGNYVASIGSWRNRHNVAVVATIFHGDISPQHPKLTQHVEALIKQAPQIDKIVTACQLMQNRLVGWGVPAEKLIVLPLGVDLATFRPPSSDQRATTRHRLGIPNNAYCIGSFQKDGEGWEHNGPPKRIKGPDIFLDVIAQLKQRHPNLFVLLTAPARGYVTAGLAKIGVPYRHDVLDNYHDIVPYYHALDAYLVTSREEGGPKAILESMATGVPIVSTRVGMAPDVVVQDQNGLLANVEDVNQLANHLDRLIQQPELGDRLTSAGQITAHDYNWDKIGAEYFQRLYRPLIKMQQNKTTRVKV